MALVKKYVEDNPDITFAELQQVFPRRLQGSWGVFDLIENATEIINRSNRRRHFIKPDEIILLKDSKIAICTQWGTGNIENILRKANELKYEVQTVVGS